MLDFFQYKNLPIIIAGLVLMIGSVVIIFFIRKAVLQKRDEELFEEMLLNAELETIIEDETKSEQVNFKTFWSNLLKKSKLVDVNIPDKSVDMGVLGLFIASYAIMLVIAKNMIMALFAPASIGIIIYFIANRKLAEREHIMNEQITSFLHIFKANLQASETADRALIGAIDNTADPLFEELKVTRAYIESGSMRDALMTLRLTTTNDSLRFLCSCIELASETGGNLESQIDVIDELLEVKRSNERKYESAVSENKILMYIAPPFIVGIFVYLYISLDIARDYWFVEPFSYVLLLIIAGLVAGAVFGINYVLKSTKNF